MPRRRGSPATTAHAERMRALLAGPALPLEPVAREEGQQPRARGRPPGARNWVDGQIAKYLEARGYIHPAIAWAEICSRPIRAIALELGLETKDAAALWFRASENLKSLIAQDLPKSVQIDARGDFQLTIELGKSAAAPIGDAKGVLIEGEALPIDNPAKSEG